MNEQFNSIEIHGINNVKIVISRTFQEEYNTSRNVLLGDRVLYEHVVETSL